MREGGSETRVRALLNCAQPKTTIAYNWIWIQVCIAGTPTPFSQAVVKAEGLVGDVLKDVRDLFVAEFCTKKVIVHLAQLGIGEMVPSKSESAQTLFTPGPIALKGDSRASISIEQSGGLDKLLAVSTSLALVCIVRVRKCFGVELEELAEVVLGEVTGGIFCLVHHAC